MQELEELPFDALAHAIKEETPEALAAICAELDEEKLGLFIESLPEPERLPVWQAIDNERRIDVLLAMHGDARLSLLKLTPTDQLDQLLRGLDAEDLMELAESLPDHIVDYALAKLDSEQQLLFKRSQEYDDSAVGRWVSHDPLVLPQNARVHEAVRLLRNPVPPLTEFIYLIDRTGRFVDGVSINDILRTPGHVIIATLEKPEIPVLAADLNVEDAADQVKRSGFSALPVVTEEKLLLGRLHLADAMTIVEEAAETRMMASAGLDADEDLFAPIKRSAQSRAVWLGINLITAFLASWFIGLFEATLEQVVALAVLMPVVASMGGIAGSQTATIVVRGLALGQISTHNYHALFQKELKVSGINGVIWCVIVGWLTVIWFDSYGLAIVIAIAIIINIICAGIAGVLIPTILDKLKVDPALAASVILTTVTDIVGFVAFLGLGTLFLV